MKSPIALISTLTSDVICDSEGKEIRTAEGGPALFIGRALAAEGVEFKLHQGPKLRVEIVVRPEGEVGKIAPFKSALEIGADLLAPWTIVSTVLQEWRFAEGVALPQQLCVDIQGFVRDGDRFGGKRQWDIAPVLVDQIFCMKGTAEEFNYLPADIIERQKHRILLITNGAKGVDAFINGSHHSFPVKSPVLGLANTIGAGDTLLGYFAAGMYRGLPVEQAIEAAMSKTAVFLRVKSGG